MIRMGVHDDCGGNGNDARELMSIDYTFIINVHTHTRSTHHTAHKYSFHRRSLLVGTKRDPFIVFYIL